MRVHACSAVAALSLLCACTSEAPTSNGERVVSVADHDKAAAEMKARADELGLNIEGGSENSEGQPKPTNWSYDTQRDEMRDATSYFAIVRSDTAINLGFPYDADRATITLRKRPSDGQSVLLRAPGQFLCRTYNDDTVAVKFDDGPIQRFSCAEPSDASSGLIFINSEGRFIEKLKNAKRLIIEAEMYQAGPQQMVFSVEGLTWPPESKDAD